MVERISKKPAPSLRSAAVVTERCKLKVEKKAKKASSSLFCDSVMSQVELTGQWTALTAGAYIIEHSILYSYGLFRMLSCFKIHPELSNRPAVSSNHSGLLSRCERSE